MPYGATSRSTSLAPEFFPLVFFQSRKFRLDLGPSDVRPSPSLSRVQVARAFCWRRAIARGAPDTRVRRVTLQHIRVAQALGTPELTRRSQQCKFRSRYWNSIAQPLLAAILKQ